MTSQKLAAAAVGSTNLATGSVTKEKIAAGVLGNVETLKTGQTERGVFSIGGTKEAAKDASAFGSIGFPWLLAANPVLVEVVAKGAVTANCKGLGGGNTASDAAANVVCVYLTTETNLEGTGATALTAEATRLGVNLTAKGKKAEEGNFVASGVWAVTAP